MNEMERSESSNLRQAKTPSLSLWVSAPRCTPLSLRVMSKPTCVPKGVGKEAMETLKHSDYVQCLADGTSNIIKMQSIRSINQQLYTMEMLKKGLSCNDVKRWICEDGINTEPYGYVPCEPTTLLEPGDICPWHVYEIYNDEEEL